MTPRSSARRVTSHTFRKTVASRMDPSTTIDHYIGRRAITTPDHAAALSDLAARR